MTIRTVSVSSRNNGTKKDTKKSTTQLDQASTRPQPNTTTRLMGVTWWSKFKESIMEHESHPKESYKIGESWSRNP